MKPSLKRKLVVGSVVALAVVGGGAAIAASKGPTPQQRSQAIVNDAAKQLGVQPSALSDALKKAISNQIDAAVAAGQITKAQGDALKARIQSGELPLFGVGGMHGGFGHHGMGMGLDAAASYLGLTEAQLHDQLESGKTLAQIAKAQGKSVDGLIKAMVDDAKKHLDAAVAAGQITKEQEQQILSTLEQRITAMVNGQMPGPGMGGPGMGPGMGHGMHGDMDRDGDMGRMGGSGRASFFGGVAPV